MRVGKIGWAAALLVLLTGAQVAHAQIPHIDTFFPIGGKAGTTVDVEIRGSSLAGANQLLAHGTGVTGTVQPGSAKVDETNKPLWQAKCQSCHELRSPANRSMSPAQWAATVERMVKVRQAPLSAEEMEKVSEYLVSMARAGRVTAQIKIAPDTLPGIREVRICTPRGISNVCLFEVGALPEIVAVSNKRETAQPLSLPCVVNGAIVGNGERHFFKFPVKKGARLVFNLKGCRYNDRTQEFFNPDLRLYDAAGKELVENHGYYDLDPLIDWTCPADGDYTLEVRDLLGHGNPSSVYRLTMGSVPYDTILYPPGGQAHTEASIQVVGKDLGNRKATYTLKTPAEPGLTQVDSPCGPHPFVVSPYPVVCADEGAKTPPPSALPTCFAGRILKADGHVDFPIQGNGTFFFELYVSRIGSSLAPSYAVIAPDGKTVASGSLDMRFGATLEPGKTYTLRVAANKNLPQIDDAGSGGADHVFFVDVQPARPAVECVARPDNITLRPGLSTDIEVILTRRENVTGDIQLTAEGLPPGVTVQPTVIQPDRGVSYLTLTAAPDAKPSQQEFRIVATAKGPTGETRVVAVGQELYRVNNQPYYYNREESALAVRGEPDFTAQILTPEPIYAHPKKGFEVKVKITRKGNFKGGVVARLLGLPQGWVTSDEGIGGDKDVITLLVRPDGNNPTPFLKRDPKLTPIRATLDINADEFHFAFGTMLVQPAKNWEEDEKRRR